MNHIQNRETEILKSLKEELIGPAPAGREIDCSGPITFLKKEESYGPWRQKGSGEEILDRGKPTQRYGIGVLYPLQTAAGDEVGEANGTANIPAADVENEEAADQGDSALTDKALKDIERIEKAEKMGRSRKREMDPDDFDLSTANTYRPSSMGVSFLAELDGASTLDLKLTGGRYTPVNVSVGSSKRIWWKRSPVSITFQVDGRILASSTVRKKHKPSNVESKNAEGLKIEAEVYSRPVSGGSPTARLITVCVINRHESGKELDRFCLFQTHFAVGIQGPNGRRAAILPYPSSQREREDFEEQSLALLYRGIQTFAVGHGCSADWSASADGRVSTVTAEALPYLETPSITADVTRDDNVTKIEVPIPPLAGLVPGDDGSRSIKDLIESYESWIKSQRAQIPSVPDQLKTVATEHMKRCEDVLGRMKAGWDFLNSNPKAKKAFQYANHAILLQQVRSEKPVRKIEYDPDTANIKFEIPYSDIDVLKNLGRRGKWRAFQIAFLLMAVQSVADGRDVDRETVELIWFPTGGGKTEAYLGLAAYAMFFRRLSDPKDAGVHVLMRYTLRLLTAQQFQRASGLICSMDHIRQSAPDELGTEPFSIGLWLGDDVTPNRRTGAIQDLKDLGFKYSSRNRFVLDRCPWCKAQMGPVELKGAPKVIPRVHGYEKSVGTVIFRCPDHNCEFSKSNLPVFVIDEDIYDFRPTMVIATVDKFAALAWRPEARSIFGIDGHGTRIYSPPGLIIQDELHLISGPLGSMVGLYETLIEELATDRRTEPPVLPKIISSTATIRQYEPQIKALYAREKVTLFPPPGLEAKDSFFARYATDPQGKLLPGKIYTGVFAAGLGSMQTSQVRTFSALLQAPMRLANLQERDPWWTLMMFFNSLRELGTTLSLFQSDIPDYLRILCNRYGIQPADRRRLFHVLELTGRLRSDEIPAAMSELEKRAGNDKFPVDACLASNIIEVGIDIDRLSLLTVVGQPKTTSQYIQVTGRVGRKWDERPGLVVTIYGVSKPRDRSHFEKFRSYHEKLYAQVEPTSATPFSPPVLDRALHGLMAAFVRQAGDRSAAVSPNPYPENLIENLRSILLPRVRRVDPAEVNNFSRVFDKRISEWKRWKRILWEAKQGGERPLLRRAGAYVTDEMRERCWETPLSLRNVDAECEAHITDLYTDAEELEDIDV